MVDAWSERRTSTLHLVRSADEAEVGVRRVADHQVRVLAGQADGAAALGVDRLDDALVDAARQDHLDDLDRGLVGDALAALEAAFDLQAPEQIVDHRAAAVDDHRVHAHLLHQDDVAGEASASPSSSPIAWPPNLMTTVAPVVALQIGQRFAQSAGGGDPVSGHGVLLSHRNLAIGSVLLAGSTHAQAKARSGDSGDDGAQLVDAIALFRRGHDQFGKSGGVGLEAPADLVEDTCASIGLDLVGLGQHRLERHGGRCRAVP